MAVETGYSKIVTSGSVFLYDTGDTVNSYKGEPTTNIYATDGFSFWQLDGNHTATRYAGAAPGLTAITNNYDYSTITTTGNWSAEANRALLWTNAGILQLNTQYAVSFYARVTSTSTANIGAAFYGNQLPNTITITSDWQRYTLLSSTTSTFRPFEFGSKSGAITFQVAGIQYEAKTYSTPYINASRSTTQAMIDVVGGNTINLANMSYGANNAISFDGTDDYITVPSYTPTSNTQMTIDIWTRPDSTTQATTLMSKWGASGLGNFSWLLFLNWFAQGNVYFLVGNSTGNNYSTSTMAHNLSTSAYSNFTITYNAGAISMYRNGVLITTNTSPYTTLKSVTTPLTVGADFDAGSSDSLTRPYDGQIPIAKVYSRALSASEVLANFNHYKTRFNIT